MNSEQYKQIVSHRLQFPENNNPKYTLINHCKIDFVNLAMKLVDASYYAWIDFGYLVRPESRTTRKLDLSKLDLNRINYVLINPINEKDLSILYTLQYAPEKIGGGFFFGSKQSMIDYQKLFHLVHQSFQNMNIADDDQHIVLRCYTAYPELFKMHYLHGNWYAGLTHFS